MRELNVNEIEQVSGGMNIGVGLKAALEFVGKSVAGGLIYDALKASFPEPRTPTTRGQMGRNN